MYVMYVVTSISRNHIRQIIWKTRYGIQAVYAIYAKRNLKNNQETAMGIIKDIKDISSFYGKSLVRKIEMNNLNTCVIVNIQFDDESEAKFRSDPLSRERQWKLESGGQTGHSKSFVYRIMQVRGCRYINRKYVNGKYIDALFSMLINGNK